MIVDFHTHTFPDAIAQGAVDKLKRASHTRPFSDGTVGGLRASMAAAGIGASLVLPVATSPRQVIHVNDASIRMNERAGDTRVYSFGCMHPDFPDWRDELARVARAGLRGIKIHPPYQGVDVDDARYLRILSRAGEMDLTVVTHAGLDVGLPGAEHSTPEKLLRAAKAVGPVRLVCAHMGGWRCWDRVEALLPQTKVYLDASFALGPMTPLGDGFYPDEKSLQMLGEEQFLRLVRLFGADRVLFGTDSPWADQAAYLGRIRALPLTAEEKRLILGANAARLLGIPCDEPNGQTENGRE